MENKGLIYERMSAVMADIGAISKSNTNTAQNFKFRGVDQFVNALHPALIKHKVFMAPKVTKSAYEINEVQKQGRNGEAITRYDKHVHLEVEYTFYTDDGSSVTVGPIASEGLDNGDKATNKALSAALKYALIQTFSVPTEDMVDADHTSPVIEKEAKKSASPEKESKPTFQLTPPSPEEKKKNSFRIKPAQPAEAMNG